MREEHLTPDDFMAADFVNTTFDGYRPELNQEAGDMILPNDHKNAKGQRNAVRDRRFRWPDAKVPYIITGKYSPDDRAVIARGMKEFHENSCIKFIPRTTEEAYIDIVDTGDGCKSWVGRMGTKQLVWLPTNLYCVNIGMKDRCW